MRNIVYTLIISFFASALNAQDTPVNIRLEANTLMHEMRATPSPTDKSVVANRAVSFQWPLHADAQVLESGLDGSEGSSGKKVDKSKLRYQLRYSQDPTFKKGATQVETRWPFSGEGSRSRSVALAIWIRHQWKNGMEQQPPIHR